MTKTDKRMIYGYAGGCKKCGGTLLVGELFMKRLRAVCAGCGTARPDLPADPDSPPRRPKRQRELPSQQDTRLYRFIPHVCRLCGGRLAKTRPNSQGVVCIRCAICGSSILGPNSNKRLHEELCACGAKLANGKSDGLRCVRVRSPSPAMQGEVVVVKEQPRSSSGPPDIPESWHREK